MENTLENKAKFFAQYWGQEILKYENSDGDKFWDKQIYPVDGHNITCNGMQANLRPLSSITDEEAIAVAKKIGLAKASVVERDNQVVFLVDDSYTVGFFSTGIITMYKGLPPNNKPYWNDISRLYDELRSRSFALPFHDLSVEQQIEYGWITINLN